MSKFKVIIAGGRDFNDYEFMKTRLDNLFKAIENITIISGTAGGADQLGERYAIEMGHLIELYPADWDGQGKAAGALRNIEMAENANALVAFWDGKSRGTDHMIKQARMRGLKVRVIHYE